MKSDDLPARLAHDLDGAFPTLVTEHVDRLYSIALRLLGDPRDAEEITSDGLVRAHRALASYPPDRIHDLELRPWLTTIVLNLARNHARRHRHLTVVIDDSQVAPTATPESTTIQRAETEHWATLIAGLPTRYRVPVVLRYVDDLDYDEIAGVLDRPATTVRSQVQRGLTLLRAAHDAATRKELSA
ncbi:MAG TPA: sigma-70 family RNA polymerase sigma factor [Candidatus Limnocylindrales bacterium]|nr:sigma-70 family RNA polymerase sigma factor [Candidatus Limnocylindrales bacterium]